MEIDLFNDVGHLSLLVRTDGCEVYGIAGFGACLLGLIPLVYGADYGCLSAGCGFPEDEEEGEGLGVVEVIFSWVASVNNIGHDFDSYWDCN